MHYFDNAATTYPKPEVVYNQMDEFYRNYGVNIGRGQFKEASIAYKMVEDTRDLLLELFHCNRGNRQVVFTSSATESMNLVIKGLNLSKDDVVYTTPFEHNAVIRTLHYLEKSIGIKVKMITPNRENMQYDFNAIEEQFKMDIPKAIIVNHASNVFGFVSPIKELFSLAKKFNAITIADMAQTAGLLDTDLIDVQCDYAIFAGHKTLYGPFGIAGIITPNNCSLNPLLHGGTGSESANPNMPKDEPIRYEAGSPNVQAVAGLNASIKWIKDIGIENIRKKEEENKKRLLELLGKFSNITVYNCNNCEEIGVTSCNFEHYSSDSIGQVLSNFDIATRTGLHCAPKAHEFMGTAPAGTVRFSVSYFTDDADFNKLEEGLQFIVDNG